MSGNFATPIAHQTTSNYTRFNNALVIGRPYRQPLTTAPDPDDYSRGLEIFLNNTGDIPALYSWFDGILQFQSTTIQEPGDRLILLTSDSDTNTAGTMAGLRIIESYPLTTIYENVERSEVITALSTLLTNAYTAAQTRPAKNWHPSMRMKVADGSQNPPRLKEYIDQHTPANTTITQMVTSFVNATDGVLYQIPVRAGERIGRAAPYLATDPLPAMPPFPLGNPTDANRARRLTFQTLDSCDQQVNPLYYLHICMRRMLLPAAQRIVTSLTNIVSGASLTHPLVALYPALAEATTPPAREQIDGQSKFPVGRLSYFHIHGLAALYGERLWRYTDDSIFEYSLFGNPTPIAMNPSNAQTNRVNNLWTDHGTAIALIANVLQIPIEVIIGLIGAEAGLDPNNANKFNSRPVRLEALKPRNRKALRTAGISAADELQYDKTTGIEGTITNLVQNANGTSRVDITLAASRKWAANKLSRISSSLLVGELDRLAITSNSGSDTSITNYRLTVKDFEFRGGFAAEGTQAAASTLFYSVSSRAIGNATETAVQTTIGRPGTIRHLRVTAGSNTLDGPTTITVFHNEAATGLTVTLPAKRRNGNDTDAAHAFAVDTDDTISVQVVTAGTTGRIKNLVVKILNAPPSTANIWVLEGFSTSIPVPWTGGAVINTGSGRTLTWDELLPIIDAIKGDRISPGMLQTLIATAREAIPWLNGIQPNIFTTLGIPAPPATAGGFVEWLAHPLCSILVGAAKIRRDYNRHSSATAFDLPVVGSAYNSGHPKSSQDSPWGLLYSGDYVGHAAPHANAAANLFNGTPAPTPAPTVRFMR